MDIEAHCRRCRELLGTEWREVHVYLDEFAKQNILTHRMLRHHREGVEEVRRLFGDEAARAAELHITDDWGFVPDRAWYDGG